MSGQAGTLADTDTDSESSLHALKDRLHLQLISRCREDPETGCWHYDGPMQSKRGYGLVSLPPGGGRPGRRYTAQRIAAWVYLEEEDGGGFKLDDRAVRIKRRCLTPGCCNYEHLRVKRQVLALPVRRPGAGCTPARRAA